MEPLNNNMDDLFQKAGDLYPLKTTESDWDGVLGKLQDNPAGNQAENPDLNFGRGQRKRRWLLLLLLIPFALGSVIYFTHGNKKGSVPLQDQTEKQKALTEVKKPSELSKTTEQSLVNTPGQNTDSKDKLKNNLPGKPAERALNSDKSNLNNSTEKNVVRGTPGSKQLLAAIPINEGTNNSVSNEQNGKAGKTAAELAGATSAVVAENSQAGNLSVATTETNSATQKKLILNDSTKPANKDSIKTNPAATAKKSDAKSKSSKGIYIGFQIGPDWSSIKFQSTLQTGYSLGLLVGYRFNDHLSVETGLMWDRKYYYSKGEYFETSKLPYQPPPDIVSLSGYCDMFEIPVNVRYNFVSKNNHGFFVKGGFSSYLMKKEDYSYIIMDNGSTRPIHPHPYYNTSNSIFSVLQFSGGYEFAISKKTKLSFEPYIKIPLQGVGIGNMPISSAGLYFGISHSFR